ncbi:AAA family ATPase [Rothia sp. (in: high G+C Gram-positive bacteria)]|uniref:AAA family ATPase n=1 Tax=Rothia sp. (in: high G+C Gram-positive bacteria) TaxID=1885016 RepID=UPI00321786DD
MILLIGNHKGGVGKSTLTVNLATTFQQQGKNVTIVEADPSIRTASRWADDRDELGHGSIMTLRKEGRLGATLSELNDSYDVVLVDTAGKDSKELRSAMVVADLMLIPARPAQADLDATVDLMQMIDEAQDMNPSLIPLIVISQASTHSMSSDAQEAKGYLEQAAPSANLVDVVIHHRKAYQVALAAGKAVTEGADSKAKAEIQLLAQEILNLTEGR